MQEYPGRKARRLARIKGCVRRVAALSIAILASAGFAAAASAQGKGAYEGTVSVTGTELGKFKNGTYAARLKVRVPLEDVGKDSAHGEVGDVDKPSASALVTDLSYAARNSSPDSDGKITSWTCKLAAPAEVPLIGSGVLDVDYRAKKYTVYVAYVSSKPVPLDCVNSRSGPYKKTETVSFVFGTNEPDVPWIALPFADASRLASTHTLVPVSAMKGRQGPLQQNWDLKFVR